MASQVKIKNSSVGGKVPLSTDLVYGELAINYADEKIYFKNSSNTIKSFAVYNPSNVSISGGSATLSTLNITGNATLGDALSDVITINGKLSSGGITFSDGTTQTTAASGGGTNVAVVIALS